MCELFVVSTVNADNDTNFPTTTLLWFLLLVSWIVIRHCSNFTHLHTHTHAVSLSLSLCASVCVPFGLFVSVPVPSLVFLTLAMIFTLAICCSLAAFLISIVRRFSSRSSPVFSRSSSRTALVIIRLFSRSTSFRGFSFPNMLPMVYSRVCC